MSLTATAVEGLSALSGRLDSVIKDVFDPMHLSGVGTYWKVMLVSLLVHVAVFWAAPIVTKLVMPRVYGQMSDSDKRSWSVCIVSLLHSVYDSAFIIAFFNDPSLNMDKMGGYNEQFEYLLATAMGYYIWDLSICLSDYSNYGIMYLIHGGLGVFGLFVLTSRQLQFYAIPYLLPELSSVFLNIRHLLKYAGKANSLAYKVNFALFLAAFISIRVGFEAYHSYYLALNVYRGDTGDVFYPFAVYFAILGITLTTLNLIWLRQILNAAYYTFFAGSKKKRGGQARKEE
ncbi:hypothetical protein IWW57_000088 [Coemansia sp. S610]|uniref:TLC domain-containing protein n=1 Tax=Coemansia spiralis TaxID=417178 RepID=A0A9W8GM54_9FUNG|nr:hypothetical protein IWW57_000088 [Coemansia sp. S610]KAJ2356522.1 hypothetical protein H4S02_012730 [Coemansia sp. RSA 2611]KAJ2688760.1 hypothetical protein IWW39_001975 [Coemansia spiralis]KAJ2697364.1 hypothetical protein H4218_004003 [Coemansia sp. IMI 209128]